MTTQILDPPVAALNLRAWFVSLRTRHTNLPDYLVLEEAIAKGDVVVKETGDVNQLVIDNANASDLFIQAGDIVKGGRQDRSFGVDFIVPASSIGVPVPVFCVEARRWGKRRSESDQAFASAKEFVASKKIRRAIVEEKSQGQVWSTVAEHQAKLSESVGQTVHDSASPSSLQLSYEHKQTADALEQYAAALEKTALPPDATGVVWAINGKPSHADIYADTQLFRKVWKKLQRAAAIEALEERIHPVGGQSETGDAPTPDRDTILAWLQDTAEGALQDDNPLPPRTRLQTHRTKSQVRFDTLDTALAVAPVHIAILAE